MYIPQKSGHVTHTIKNYILGELKRYIRYNSLKLTFLKIRTKFFSRLRNRGFKKVWLKKQFSKLKYENREMLMNRPDSDCSRPDFQMVLEKEAEDLKTSRNLLADKAPYQTDFLQDNQDIRKGLNLILMEPNRGIGGMISGQNNNLSDLICNPPSINYPIAINQEAVWETEATPSLRQHQQQQQMGPLRQKKTRMECLKNVGGGSTLKTATKPVNMYLILSSYAEPQKQTIKQLFAKEKAKLCSDSFSAKYLKMLTLHLLLQTAKM